MEDMETPDAASIASAVPPLQMGSVVQEGDLHKKLSLGCQDACFLADLGETKVGVVCDGCSTNGSRFTLNQVGAVLGARFLATALAKVLDKRDRTTEVCFGRALTVSEGRMIRFFRGIRDRMELDPTDETDFVLGTLVFSIVGFAVVGAQYWFFGMGDGCFGADGDIEVLDSGGEYLNHRVLKRKFAKKEMPHLVVYRDGVVTDRKCLWVASDGVLAILNREGGKEDFKQFLSDEFTTRRDGEGNDMTVQAFRRNLFRRYSTQFTDDIAVAVLKIQSPRLELTNGKGDTNG